MYYSQWRGSFSLEQGEIVSPAIGSHLSGGATWHKEVANFTDYPILLKSGYATTANGTAEAIVCPPQSTIRRVSSGGPRDFASYVIEPLHEVSDGENFRG